MERLRRSFYRRLSALGERFGIDALTYNRGIFLTFHEAALADAPKMADAVLQEFPNAKSLADVGCGSGGFAAEFIRRGLKVQGCEYSPRGREWCAKQGVPVVHFDVSKPDQTLPGAPYDLAVSFEVAEHIPEALSDSFVQFLTRAGRTLILTAAPPGQAGTGHINCQPKSYWIERIERHGFRHDAEAAARIAAVLRQRGASFYLPGNIMVFRQA